MCRVERVGDLNRVPKRLIERQRAFLQAFSQRLPFEVLHDEVVDAVLLTHIMERADMRVIQRRDGAGFALEAFAETAGRRRRASGRTLIATVRSRRVSRAL